MATRSELSPPRHSWNRYVRVAIPLALGIVLTLSLIFLASLKDAETPPLAVSTTPTAEPEVTPDSMRSGLPRMPTQDPSHKNPYTPLDEPNYGGEFPRWNIKKFPEGWDPELARDLHDFFESLVTSRADPNLRLSEIRAELREYLASLGPESLPTLGTILNAESDFVYRRFLLYGIGGIGPESEEATFYLRDFFAARRDNPQNYSEMLHTVDAMGHLQNETAFETLNDYAHRDDLHTFRPKIIENLAYHPRSEEAVGSIVDFMKTDGMTNVRNKAAQFLGRVQHPDSVDDLHQAVGSEPHWVVQQTMLGAIGKIGNPNSIRVLEEHARHNEDARVRLSAARALSRIGTPHAFRILESVSQVEPNVGNRERMVKWIPAEGD